MDNIKSMQDIINEKRKAELEMLEELHTSKNEMADDKEVRYIAVCKVACTFRRQFWPVGRQYRGFKKPPKHFEIIEEITYEKAGGCE